jgi:YHS domain-containing protein
MKQFLWVLIATVSIHAQAQRSEIFAPDGKAIKGFDPVAFFKESKAVMGVDSLVYSYKGVNWFFASRENLNAFTASPEEFTPQYGGYCAYGASQGYKASTETDTWTMLDGMLYFNYNQKVKAAWKRDPQSYIKKADQNWPVVKHTGKE